MPKEYIERSFVEYSIDFFGSMLTWSKEEVLSEIKRNLDKGKADVVEVVHGEWVSYDGDSWKCSICGEENCYAVTTIAHRKFVERYCCNCGAKMDGKKESKNNG